MTPCCFACSTFQSYKEIKFVTIIYLQYPVILKLCRLNSIHLAIIMVVLEIKGIHRWIHTKYSVLYLLFILYPAAVK